MKVHVGTSEGLQEYANISAIGIGHLRKDLVLVPEDGKPIEIKPDEWSRLLIEK